jgi:hypothetical protein
MADNTLTTAADMPDQTQQKSPFMKLPTELRLRIYKFALDDIVDDIESDVANKKRVYEEVDALIEWPSPSKVDHPIFVGVLSFLHTSRKLRRECLDALRAPTEALMQACRDQHKAAAKACRIPIGDGTVNSRQFKDLFCSYQLRHREWNEALHRHRRIRFIFNAVSLIARRTMSSSQRELVRPKQHRLG